MLANSEPHKLRSSSDSSLSPRLEGGGGGDTSDEEIAPTDASAEIEKKYSPEASSSSISLQMALN